jgi:hypothetical protein
LRRQSWMRCMCGSRAGHVPKRQLRSVITPACVASNWTRVSVTGTALKIATGRQSLVPGRLDSISARTSTSPQPDPLPASLCVARLGRDGRHKPARVAPDVPPELLLKDKRKVYQARLDPRAAEQILNIASHRTPDRGLGPVVGADVVALAACVLEGRFDAVRSDSFGQLQGGHCEGQFEGQNGAGECLSEPVSACVS